MSPTHLISAETVLLIKSSVKRKQGTVAKKIYSIGALN